jgi:hypothetical protein
MSEISEFFGNLLDVSDWPPRWICGKWSDFHGWLYIISDLTIWLAYFLIPVILMWFIQQNRRMPFLPVFWLFVAFILFCGLTHALDALIFWWPAYRLSALVRFFTAVVSMWTVFALIKHLPKVLELKTQEKPESSLDENFEENYLAAIDKLYEKDMEIDRLKAELKIIKGS